MISASFYKRPEEAVEIISFPGDPKKESSPF
jgi:hypothetical protein